MSIIHSLNANSPAITAIATTALVMVTYIYVRQLNKERHEIIKPIIWVRKPVGCFESVKTIDREEMLCLGVENIGRGHAFEVQFECSFSKNAIVKKISFNYCKYLFGVEFVKGKTHYLKMFYKENSIDIHTGLSLNVAKNNYTCVMIKMKYKDELGKKYGNKVYINFQDYNYLHSD